MSRPRQPRAIMVQRVNFLWYALPILPIIGAFYAAIAGYLPSWVALIAVFAFFMWLFSLLFTLFAVLTRRNKDPRS